MSMSPPSFLMRVVLPSCILFKIATALFSHTFRSHSSTALWATRDALSSEAGFEKVFRTQNWVRRSKLFCRWFCFLLGQAGCISVDAWTQLKVAFYLFVSSGGLIVCCWTKAHQPFAAYRWLLEVFLAVAEFVGFCAGGRLPFEWLYWILYSPLLAPPCWPPPCPSRLLPKFSAQKEHESWSFQSIPLLINNINLKRDGEESA